MLKDKIKTIKVKKLIPYENNAKVHTEEQIQKIVKSIKQYGYKQLILVDKKNVIIAGHGRHAALMEIDPEMDIEVIRADDLTPEQVKKLRIADNKVVSEEYDMGLLNQEIKEIYTDYENIEIILEELFIPAYEIDIMSFEDEREEGEETPKEKEFSGPVDTEHKCPRCGYEW
jgi:ParB-like chromosome segregation protein Spo0J